MCRFKGNDYRIYECTPVGDWRGGGIRFSSLTLAVEQLRVWRKYSIHNKFKVTKGIVLDHSDNTQAVMQTEREDNVSA